MPERNSTATRLRNVSSTFCKFTAFAVILIARCGIDLPHFRPILGNQFCASLSASEGSSGGRGDDHKVERRLPVQRAQDQLARANAEADTVAAKPAEGLAHSPKGTVALTVDEPSISADLRGVSCGSMGRELIRQSILIAAREELGLSTLDGTLDELVLTTDSPTSYPLQMDMTLESRDEVTGDIRVQIVLSRYGADGKTSRWTSPSVKMSTTQSLIELAEQVEPFSRKEFVAALKEMGYTAAPVTALESKAIVSDSEDHLDFVFQFGRLRNLHARRKVQGESVENLGELVRAYANLGSLVEFHWAPTWKALSARSLIYSHRMVAKYGSNSNSLGHRAYAWALAGNHAQALKDVKAAQADSQSEAPKWLPLIEAYCQYDLPVFEKSGASNLELSSYLHMRIIDARHHTQAALEAVAKFESLNPASYYVLEVMCETNRIRSLRIATEDVAIQIWPEIYDRLTHLTGFPAAAQKIASQQSNSTGRVNVDTEHPARLQLMKELEKAGSTSERQEELSWRLLANMLKDVTFVEAWRRLSVESKTLGLPIEQVKATYQELLPMFKEHRFGKYLTTFTGERELIASSYQELMKSAPRIAYEARGLHVVHAAYQVSREDATQLDMFVYRHVERLYDDMQCVLRIGAASWRTLAGTSLRGVAPNHPRSFAYSVQSATSFSDETAQKWELKFQKDAYIQFEMGRKYRRLNRSEDAIRCLKQSIAVEPSHEAYFALADEYQDQQDFETCVSLLKEAEKLPGFGLEQGRASEKIAKILMRQGKWKEAKVHAENAASTYSGWGLFIAGRCAEGLKNWKEAERYYQALSERYEGNAMDWFYACVRWNRGDRKAARAFADSYLNSRLPNREKDQVVATGLLQIIDGNSKAAQQTYLKAVGEESRTPFFYIMGALLADHNDDAVARDDVLKQMGVKFNQHSTLVRLAGMLLSAVQDRSRVQWNELSFQEIVDGSSNDDDVTLMYFCAGKFLDHHGEKKLATQYLQCAASSSDVKSYGCLLATLVLRGQKAKIPETRLNRHPDDRIAALKLTWKRDQAVREKKYEAAAEALKEALKLRPDLTIAYLSRGKLHEAQGQYQEAILAYQNLLKRNPNSEYAHLNLSILYASCPQDDVRNGAEATKCALKALELRGFLSPYHLTLVAAAYAENREFDKAIEHQERAIKLYPNVKAWNEQLESFRNKKPLRFTVPVGAAEVSENDG